MAMETSILKSTKKILGVGADYTPFDLDILTHINSAFSIVSQIGVGPLYGFFIEDESAEWADISLPPDQLALLRTYIFLNVRLLFDPPTTSFAIDAAQKQLDEHLVRLSYFREGLIPHGEVETIIGPPGPEGPQGPPGLPGFSFLFEFTQSMASTTWVIVHNLNGFPNVSTVDSLGNEMHGGVEWDSPDQITVTFSTPTSGKAYLS